MKTRFTKSKILNPLQLTKKRLTLPGKITIIKTLAESQLVYIMSLLRPYFKTLKEKFLRNGKGTK